MIVIHAAASFTLHIMLQLSSVISMMLSAHIRL